MTINSGTCTTNSVMCTKFIKCCYTYAGNKHTDITLTGTHKHNKPVNKLPKIGWASGLLPIKLANINPGPMGSPSSGWLPTGTNWNPLPAAYATSDKVLNRSTSANISRDCGAAYKRGNHRDTTNTTKLCVPDLPGREKGWGPETCDKSKGPQPLCEDGAFQNGGSSPAPRPITATRLDGENGSQGCVPPDPHPPRIPTSAHLPMGGQELYVPVSTIWPVVSTQSVHKADEASGGVLETNRLSTYNLSRRHPDITSEQRTTTADHTVDYTTFRMPGPDGQSEEIHNNSHAGVRVLGFPALLINNEPVDSFREVSEDSTGCQTNAQPSASIGEGDSSLRGEGYSHDEGYPISATALPSPPVLNEFCPTAELHTGGDNKEIQYNAGIEPGLQSRPTMVDILRDDPGGSPSTNSIQR